MTIDVDAVDDWTTFSKLEPHGIVNWICGSKLRQPKCEHQTDTTARPPFCTSRIPAKDVSRPDASKIHVHRLDNAAGRGDEQASRMARPLVTSLFFVIDPLELACGTGVF
jgi:hypothetical protein